MILQDNLKLEEKVEEFTKSDDAENFIGSIKFKEAKMQEPIPELPIELSRG